MFLLRERSDAEAETLIHSDRVFQEALARGCSYYHVSCKSGDYDIEYKANDADVSKEFLKKAHLTKVIPDYAIYDEDDTDSLYLEYFGLFKALCIEEANEYTIVLSKLAIKHSDMEIYCLDGRLKKFFEDNERIHIVDAFPELAERMFLRVVSKPDRSRGVMNPFVTPSVFAFHNIFFLQALLNGKKLKDVKYLEYVVEERSGIASILIRLAAFKNAFARFGLKVGIRRGSGRYKTEMTEKYFNIDFLGDDADENNTIQLDSVALIVPTVFYQRADKSFDSGVINQGLKAQMDEYFDAVFKGKSVLGLLIRGTDYLTTGQIGERIMATVDDMIPMIDEWMAADGYEYVFLASEDADICEKMVAKYGDKLRMLSQERHRVSDFKDVTIISELEKKKHTGQEYDDALEDTTINYFYALYILSRCDSFICSGQCNGYDLVNAFNEGKFKKVYKFSVGTNKNP